MTLSFYDPIEYWKPGPATLKVWTEGPDMTNMCAPNGRMWTAMFWESVERFKKDPGLVKYTMKGFEKHGLASAKIIYMMSYDEYDAAIRLLGSWEHWKKLCKSTWFFNGYKNNHGRTWGGLLDWREEKEKFEQSLAKKQIIKMANEGNFAAAKILLDGAKGAVGRPASEKVLQEARREAEQSGQITQDLRRIRLAVNNATKKKNSTNVGANKGM